MEVLTPPEYQGSDQNVSPSIPQKNIYKILFFVFLSLFLLFLIIIIVVAILSLPQKSAASLVGKIQEEEIVSTPISTKPTLIPSTKLTITPATPSSFHKAWKTYTNSTYKFSIDYPSDWIIKKESNYFTLESAERNYDIEINGIQPLGPEISVKIYDSFSDSSEYEIGIDGKEYLPKEAKNLEKYVFNNYNDVKKILINGVSGYSGYSDYPDHRIYLQKGNLIINIIEDYSYDHSVYESNQINKMNIIKKIIESLKFN